MREGFVNPLYRFECGLILREYEIGLTEKRRADVYGRSDGARQPRV